MLKYTFVIVQLLSAFFFASTLEDGVIIEDNTPPQIAPGEERMVEISVNKGDVTGFAKLQLDLPEGLSAEAGDLHGSSFTFADGKVKYIWQSLPADQVFTVSYKLKAAPSASGNKVIKGIFSYIKSNQRVDYEMQSKLIEIRQSDPLAQKAGPSNMQCVRSITDMGNGDFLVRLNIQNATNEGFVQIRETFPSTFTASENETSGAIATASNGMMKFVWYDAPTSNNYSVSYRLTGGMGDPVISGKLSYVEANTPRDLTVLSPGTITRAASPTADNTDEEEDLAELERQEAEARKKQEEARRLEEEKASALAAQEKAQREAEAKAKAEAEARKAATSVPDAETGVMYKVQIAAAHRVVDAKYFKQRHGFDEDFGIENHEGWVKYTTGSHDVYKSARDNRERIRNRYNFRGPFVTAYNDGERITVQEALMITRQKWYK